MWEKVLEVLWLQVFFGDPVFGSEGTCFTSKKELVATNEVKPSAMVIWVKPSFERALGKLLLSPLVGSHLKFKTKLRSFGLDYFLSVFMCLLSLRYSAPCLKCTLP